MSTSRPTPPDRPQLRDGDRLLIPCQGGPSIVRLVYFPPPLELEERGGMYVLDDDGRQDQWVYEWVPVEL